MDAGRVDRTRKPPGIELFVRKIIFLGGTIGKESSGGW